MDKQRIINDLEIKAKRMRINALKMAFSSGSSGAHVGPGLSIIEILAVLYGYVLNLTPENVESDERDRFILSKEHGVLAYYSGLAEAGILSKEDLNAFMKTGGELLGHPVINRKKGIEFTSGSLGMGLSLGVGVALALKKKGIESSVYVLMGDGECNEGSVWEAIMSASQLCLSNLTMIIDANGIQLGGTTKEIMEMSNLRERFESFGWDVIEVDGHDISALFEVFMSGNTEKPKAIIAKTIKGKGVSFMENNIDWHHAVLTEKLYKEAIAELGEGSV